MNPQIHTLIITGAIDIRNFNVFPTALVDLNNRLEQYLYSIKYAIQNYKSIKNIIFCDNTDYKYDYSNLFELAKVGNKNIEIFSFQGDYTSIERYGKGYGEGEIIEYILNNSKLIHTDTCFYKLTGRLIITNFDSLVIKNLPENLFVLQPPQKVRSARNYIETFFYRVNIDLYKKELMHVYKTVSDKDEFFMEHAFYKALKDCKDIKTFHKYPIVIGQSGTTGVRYDLSKFRIFEENIYFKLGIHNLHKTKFQEYILSFLQFILSVQQKIVVFKLK
ncbi:MAG: hypothetical protein LBO74_09810 [Candidatus Symbiothrix sp.]|jgi:hypothetical protein|nr:hypothetical protein [Candidatus Symbiothrix sp.]